MSETLCDGNNECFRLWDENHRLREALEDVANNQQCSCYQSANGGPCPRCIVSYEQARALLAASSPAAPQHHPECGDDACHPACSEAIPAAQQWHRCGGCGHRWEGRLLGLELCGDCWRQGQAAILGRGDDSDLVTPETYVVEPTPERDAEWHIVGFRDGRQVHIYTERPVVLVEPERH